MKTARVLVVEDNEGDVFLVEEALRHHDVECNLHLAENGSAALRYLEGLAHSAGEPCPDVAIIDLNLPEVGGYDILKTLRSQTRCSSVPVIIMTSSDAPKDRLLAEALGVSRYFRKPSDLAGFLELGAAVRAVITTGTQPRNRPHPGGTPS